MPDRMGLSSSWVRGMKRGLNHALRSEGSLTAVAALFGIFLLAQVMLTGIIGAEAGLTFLRERLDLRIEVRDTASDTEVQDFIQAVHALPSVSDVAFITREQALARQKQRDPTLVDFLGTFGIENPFPDTIGVRLKRLNDAPAFLTFIQQPAYAAVVNPAFLTQTTDQQQQVERLATIVASSQILLWCGVVLVLGILLLVVIEFIRRRALLRREEISVQQVIGFRAADLSVPFAAEMGCLLVPALLLSWICAVMLVWVLPYAVPALGSGGVLMPWSAYALVLLRWWSPWVILGEVIVVGLLAVGGTWFALAGSREVRRG